MKSIINDYKSGLSNAVFDTTKERQINEYEFKLKAKCNVYRATGGYSKRSLNSLLRVSMVCYLIEVRVFNRPVLLEVFKTWIFECNLRVTPDKKLIRQVIEINNNRKIVKIIQNLEIPESQ